MFGKAKSFLLRYDLDALLRMSLSSIGVHALVLALSYVELQLGLQPWHAIAINFWPAAGLSFLLNRSWTFAKRPALKGQAGKYLGLYAVIYVGALLCAAGLEAAGLPGLWAIVVTMVFAAVGLFLGLNLWVFRGASTAKSDAAP